MTVKKNSKTTEAYAELGRLSHEPMTPAIAATLRKTIHGKTSLLVSRAVDIAAANNLVDLVPDMLDAFGRFVENGADVDKGCRAKTSIINALNKLEFLGSAIFLAGAYYKQMEPSFGPPEDTAVEVRSGCALALARIAHAEAHYVLADLLVDSERTARQAAANALTYLADPAAESLLRLKVLTGDRDSGVIAECFTGLMSMSPKRSVDFVARYLDSLSVRGDNVEAIIESAALALGGSHLPEALAKLISAYDHTYSSDTRRSLLLPIALIRSDEAFERLLDIVRHAEIRVAVDAIAPLRLYTGDRYVDRIRDVVKHRGDRLIVGRFEEEFGS